MMRIFSATGKSCRPFPEDDHATTAVEFAIVMPMLFAVMFGLIGFGVQFATRIALTYAATEGGRAAVAGLDDSERQSLAETAIANTLAALSPLVDSSKAAVTVDLSQESSDEKITISIAYSDDRFATLPFLPDFSSLNPVTVAYYVTDPSG
jgi:Flp pilus assembly protein TadG